MSWLICAALVWIIILLIVRLKELGRLWSAGFWSLLVCYYLNQFFLAKGFYSFQDAFLTFQGVPLLLLAAGAGGAIIMMRFLPEQKGLQSLYLILISAGLTGLKFVALSMEDIIFLHWSLPDSFVFTLIALITIVWLSNLTIKQKKGIFFS